MKKQTAEILLIAALILVVSMMRLVTNELHLWNFSPIGAAALFSGARMKDKRLAFIIPVVCMIVTDAILGFHSGMWLIYGTMLLIALIGFQIRNRPGVLPVVSGSLAASVLFFLITNFALLYSPAMYPHSWDGVVAGYVAGIPFFGNTVAGDLFFSAVLFGSFAWMKRSLPVLAGA